MIWVKLIIDTIIRISLMLWSGSFFIFGLIIFPEVVKITDNLINAAIVDGHSTLYYEFVPLWFLLSLLVLTFYLFLRFEKAKYILKRDEFYLIDSKLTGYFKNTSWGKKLYEWGQRNALKNPPTDK